MKEIIDKLDLIIEREKIKLPLHGTKKEIRKTFSPESLRKQEEMKEDVEELETKIKKRVTEFQQLIHETFSNLPPDGTAVIVTHDIIAAPLLQTLQGQEIGSSTEGIDTLSGFSVSDSGNITEGHLSKLVSSQPEEE